MQIHNRLQSNTKPFQRAPKPVPKVELLSESVSFAIFFSVFSFLYRFTKDQVSAPEAVLFNC